jgi:non-ribosomal peptide synthase protein (TIGR01720 family)
VTALPALTTLIVGGEACPAELVTRWAPGRRFFNAYGPSEATVCATFARCNPDGRKPPIGRPIANTTAYVLDGQLRPAPLGVPGELYLGGAGLARGYLDRPGLTAERFIASPFAEQPGARLYKTGDLCRWLPDGNLEFLGRVDQQVKIRGHRVEPGEIEVVLQRHPRVRQSVVVARDDHGQGKRLVAYVVQASDASGNGSARQPASEAAEELRNHLGERLPSWMVPSAFVFLPALPLTANGKVDSTALPAPVEQEREAVQSYVAPRNAIEEALAAIWSGVLNRQRIGIHDNFFALGGDSILSIQIVARANQAGLRLRPNEVLQHQTIAELVEARQRSGAATEPDRPLHAEQGAVTGPVPLTPIQRWFFDLELAEPHHFNQAVALEVRQPLDFGLLQRAVGCLLEHHDGLRLRFSRQQSGWQQDNADLEVAGAAAATGAVVHIDLSALPAEEQLAAFEAHAAALQAGFDLGHPPLFRVSWFTRGQGRSGYLLLIAHHLVIDAVSWAILLEDLWTAYHQLRQGQPLRLPRKTTSFKHWAEQLHELVRSDSLTQEGAYWSRLAEIDRPHLPIDHPDGKNTRDSLASVVVRLDEEQTRALLQEVPRSYRTQVNDSLLAALALALRRWTGHRMHLVDLEGHGREDVVPGVDLSRTVGWFTALVPVLLDLEKSSGPREALLAIKEQLRAIPNRGIGYGLLRYLGSQEMQRQLRGVPFAEVSFNYFGQQNRGPGGAGPLGALPTGPIQTQRGDRIRLLTITAAVIHGQLEVRWGFSTNVHERATIERLAEDYLESIRDLIACCQAPEAGNLTATDFPAARLSQTELQEVLARLSRGSPPSA